MNYKYDPATGEALYDAKTGEPIPDTVAAPVARAVAPKATLSAAEIISPRNAAAQVAGAPWPQRMAASGVDALTLPLRAVAGLGAGLGSIAGSRSKLAAALGQVNPDIAGSRADAIDAFQQTMAHPGQEAQQQLASGNVPRWMNYSPLDLRLNAGAAENPATLPLIATAGLPINSIGQGIAGTLASYTGNQAGNIAAGQPTEFLPSLGDLAPTVLGAAGEYLPGPLSSLGRGIQARAKALLTSQIKPSQAKTNTEAQGLQRGLDAGMLPLVAGRTTFSIPGVAKNFAPLFDEASSQYGPLLSSMDDAGVRVSTGQAMNAAMDKMAGEVAGGHLFASPSGDLPPAWEWLGSRLAAPSDAVQVAKIASKQMPEVSAIDMPASVAQARKSSAMEEALKNPELASAQTYAALGAGQNLRAQLAAGGMNPNPAQQALGQQYSNLLERSAPLYAMEDAMIRAKNRQNRYPLSLGSLLHPLSMVQEMPATARALWDIGGLARGGGYLGPALAPTGAALSAYLGRQ
jgi:hypothetical protein